MSEDVRFPLAFDAAGNPIELPENARAWRVRRGGGRRGRPRNVFDPETGRQLEIPLGASLDELIEANCPPDRYLLYPVDDQGHVIPGVVAVTEVPEEDEDDDSPKRHDSSGGGMKSELLRTVREMAETLCRALEATTSGYGPVRPTAPVMIEQPPPQGDDGSKGLDMGQIMDVAKTVIASFQGKPPTPTGDGET
jgi:hypothetical protein